MPWCCRPLPHCRRCDRGRRAGRAAPSRYHIDHHRQTGDSMTLCGLSLAELAARLRDGSCSAREIMEVFVARAQTLNPALHAFVEIYADDAIALAEAADRARGSGFPVGPLHGLPIA